MKTPKTHVLQIRVTPDQASEFKELAALGDLSVTDFIIMKCLKSRLHSSSLQKRHVMTSVTTEFKHGMPEPKPIQPGQEPWCNRCRRLGKQVENCRDCTPETHP